MVYGLVSAGVLALDLARHPHGAMVAEAVDRVLTLLPDDLAALDGAAARVGHDAPERVAARGRLLAHARTLPRTATTGRAVSGLLAEGLPAPGVAPVLLDALQESLLGDLDGLLGMLLREEPLRRPTLPPGVRALAADLVTARWVGLTGGPDLHADGLRLAQPFLEAVPWPAPPLDPDDHSHPDVVTALQQLLDGIVRAGTPTWDDVVRRQRAAVAADGPWSAWTHRACALAHQRGRVEGAARAHLAAARALRVSGAWAGCSDPFAAALAVTGAVQLLSVSLPAALDEDADALRAVLLDPVAPLLDA